MEFSENVLGPVAQVVERTPDKGEVGRSSRPRPTIHRAVRVPSGERPNGAIAQLGERVLCKHEVVGSIPSGSTRSRGGARGTRPESNEQFARGRRVAAGI